MEVKKILYISDVNSNEPIFHSQVLPHYKELNKNFEIKLLVLGRGEEADYDYYYNSVKGDYFYFLAKGNYKKEKARLSTFLKKNTFDLIYSRGTRGGLLGTIIKNDYYNGNIALVNDVRADVIDEHKDNILNKNIFHHSNKKIFKNADILFLVSHFLKNKVCNKYNFSQGQSFVFPTFVPDEKFNFKMANRILLRREMNILDQDIVLLYSGNLATWQNIEVILDAFSKTLNKSLKMIFLTKEQGIYELIKKYGIEDNRIRIKSVEYAKIEAYYHAADFGLLIRDNTDTNKSAAPTKFSEYVNSGLSVIINSIEADYVIDFSNKNLSGFLLESKHDLLNCFNKLSSTDVKRNVVEINTLKTIVNNQTDILLELLENFGNRQK